MLKNYPNPSIVLRVSILCRHSPVWGRRIGINMPRELFLVLPVGAQMRTWQELQLSL